MRSGYTWSLSRATIPAILEHGPQDDKTILSQWRSQYIDGAAFSRPCCAINIVSFIYLAYTAGSVYSPILGVPLSTLYIIAAVLSGSGVPWALTLLRRTNGALSIRSKRECGLWRNDLNGQPWCITYASQEAGALEREKGANGQEKYKSTKALVQRWKWHNDLRTAALLAGVVTGAIAVVMDK